MTGMPINHQQIVKALVEKAAKRNVKLHLPIDYVTANKFADDAQSGCADDTSGIATGWMGLDIGPRSVGLNNEVIERVFPAALYKDWFR